jgi:hypothetical protein
MMTQSELRDALHEFIVATKSWRAGIPMFFMVDLITERCTVRLQRRFKKQLGTLNEVPIKWC